MTQIHITTDMWTAGNRVAFQGNVAHFADEEGVSRTLLLSLKEPRGTHSGENQAEILLNTLDDFRIRNKLGFLVMDNASSNDTMIRTLCAKLQLAGYVYNEEEQRLRCLGHIINLSVQEFLFGEHPDLENLAQYESTAGPSDEELQKYRQFGPLGKLHNIIIYIMRSPQRVQRFKELSKEYARGHMPVRDQQIRWNSWYMMLNRALDDIQQPLQIFQSSEGVPEADVLTANDWAMLRIRRDFLHPFHEVTKITEGRNATLNRVVGVMDYLLEHYENAIQNTTDEYMLLSIDSGWRKLMEYWNKTTERAPVYIAAMVLDPSQKWAYFERNWKPEWLEGAKQSMSTIWSTYNTMPVAPVRPPSREHTTGYGRWMQANRPIRAADELEQYLTEPLIYIDDDFDIRQWWKEQRSRLPTLARMALNIFNIPPMSSEAERVFSSAKHTITPERASLGAHTVEQLECLKYWMKTEVFTDKELTAVMASLRAAEEGDDELQIA